MGAENYPPAYSMDSGGVGGANAADAKSAAHTTWLWKSLASFLRSEVLDTGCGNGFIAHHLSSMLGTTALGIDLGAKAEAPIDYRQYDGERFPAPDNSFDAVLLCYVLHHAQEVSVVLDEVHRVLREGGLAIIYEDLPARLWDKGVCWIHNQQWRGRTGPCTFRSDDQWRTLFTSMEFEMVNARSLSRWRNLTHPVSRRFYLLQLRMGRESRAFNQAIST